MRLSLDEDRFISMAVLVDFNHDHVRAPGPAYFAHRPNGLPPGRGSGECHAAGRHSLKESKA